MLGWLDEGLLKKLAQKLGLFCFFFPPALLEPELNCGQSVRVLHVFSSVRLDSSSALTYILVRSSRQDHSTPHDLLL